MDFTTRRQRLNIPVAPLAAALVGGVTALVFTLMPVGILEDFVLESGVATVMPAAEPPLGITARAVLILVGGGGIALITWFTLLLVLGARAIVIQRAGEDGEEPPLVLRRADAHPDAPARRPLSATRDLGTPFLDIRADRPIHVTADMPEEVRQADVVSAFVPPLAEREIPADLDTPLAAFDPDAIPATPVASWPPRRAPLVDSPRPQNNVVGIDSPVAPFNPDAIPGGPASPALMRDPAPMREPAPMRVSPIQPPRRQVYDPGERFETFELKPPVPGPAPASDPVPASESISPPALSRPRDSARVETDPSASIHALLDRLERVVGRREAMAPPPPPARPDSLEETLGTLRRLASRG